MTRHLLTCKICFSGFIAIFAGLSCSVQADGPVDNQDAQVRRIPPLGLELSPEVRHELLQLSEEIDRATPAPIEFSSNNEQLNRVDWWNDVRVITRAVKLTMEGQQFYKETEIDQARKLLKLASEHVVELTSPTAAQENFAPSWSKQSGRIVAGHRSRLDDSLQPFGILVPESAIVDPKQPKRLDIWLHGRDENVSEVAFLYRRWTQDSQYLPDDTFVLQPWGRYSNAFRFAGEVDVFEALAEVQRRYAIDPNRISIRGFSMGGAGCWHLAVHHPDRFFAANPGAGFCETERFLTGFQSETLNPSSAQRRLWSLYDCPPVVRNLTNLPTIAYSGGIDRQKEAADIMTAAATEAGFSIPYVIHPESAHAIHPDSKKEIEMEMGELAKKGRTLVPQSVSWSTSSLRYPGAYWLQIWQLDQHWTKATVEASFDDSFSQLKVMTNNVCSARIQVPPGGLPKSAPSKVRVNINGSSVETIAAGKDRSLYAMIERDGQGWTVSQVFHQKLPTPNSPPVRKKRPGLQGPIDDAFLERFLIVRPTGRSANKALDAWVERELQHTIDHWRLQFRGDARVKLDTNITENDLAESNIICFGTPESNLLIARAIVQMPIHWKADEIILGTQRFDASKAIPLLIYPNPLARRPFDEIRYIVFNSGFTYREYDYLNNARQTPKLPDWAMIDATSPPTTRAAGHVIAEGFFNEQWLP